MAARIWENKESQPLTGGDNPQSVSIWEIRQQPDRAAAIVLGLQFAPLAVMHHVSGEVLLRKTWTLDPLGAADSGAWRLTVTYAPDGGDDQGGPEGQITFDATAENLHITQSLQTMGQYVPSGRDPANFKGAIGVEKDDVKGVDIMSPRLAFGWDKYLPKELVTTAFIKQLAGLVGCMNSTPFLDFEPGEVLFVGASGSRAKGSKLWAVNYKFEANPNVEDIPVGDITVTTKRGFDYLWVSYELATDDDADIVVPKPRQVNVEQVYRTADLNALGRP